ncbi:hypothetical protein EU527_18295 [Candidatus Thorarchaeota archaeon]|nr:MAG: hypothetical protein EU527_18295 [Candidatus Thorarchaeota archaeon]
MSRMKTAYPTKLKRYREGGWVAVLQFDMKEAAALVKALGNAMYEAQKTGKNEIYFKVHDKGRTDYPEGKVIVQSLP